MKIKSFFFKKKLANNNSKRRLLASHRPIMVDEPKSYHAQGPHMANRTLLLPPTSPAPLSITSLFQTEKTIERRS